MILQKLFRLDLLLEELFNEIQNVISFNAYTSCTPVLAYAGVACSNQ